MDLHDEKVVHQWRARIKKRRGKTFSPVNLREINLVAMMDMMTIILIFLLKSYSVSAMSIPVGEEISIPISSGMVNPEEAIKLTVTAAGNGKTGIIAVDEEKVMTLDEKQVQALEKMARERKFLIKELHTALSERAKAIKYIATQNPSVKFEGRILVIADKEAPYWLVTQVLFTAAEAEFEQYRLVAVRKDEG